MQQIDINAVFKKLAIKHGVPTYQIEMVYRTMFEMVYSTIKEGKMENILLHNWGRWVVTKGKLKHRKPDIYEQIYGDKRGLEESNIPNS